MSKFTWPINVQVWSSTQDDEFQVPSRAIHEGDAKSEVNLLAFDLLYVCVHNPSFSKEKKFPGKPRQRVGTRNKGLEEILQVELTDCLD